MTTGTAPNRAAALAGPAWRLPALATVSVLLVLLTQYRDTAMAMVQIWIRSETFTHAFVVPPIVAWLIWRKRAELATLQPRPSWWVVLPLALTGGIWWLGSVAASPAVMQVALTAMVVLCVPFMLGWPVTRCLAFPLAFLFFAVPVGEFLTPMLMRSTADFVVAAVRLSGVPVYREGQQLVIPSGRWAVVEACSGIRYLIASFMVGCLFAYLNYAGWRRRALFVVVSIIVPIVANWLRAYIIVMLGHLSDNRIATGVDHLVYGWVFFGIVILGLYFIGARWADAVDPPVVRATGGGDAPAAPSPSVFAAAVLALAALAWPQWLAQRPATVPGMVQLELPDTFGGWRAVSGDPPPWRPAFAGSVREVSRQYESIDAAGPAVGVYVAYFRGQNGASRLFTPASQIVDSEDPVWNSIPAGARTAQVAGRTVGWEAVRLLGGEPGAGRWRGPLTLWHLYWLGGPTVTDGLQARLMQLRHRLGGDPDDGAAVVLYCNAADGEGAERRLNAFVTANFDALAQQLALARSQR